jgi:hypothetical protein
VVINKGELRVGRMYPSERFDEGGTATEWFHPACMFETFKRARAATRKIEDESDIGGFALLDDADKVVMRDLLARRGEPPLKKPKSAAASHLPTTPAPTVTETTSTLVRLVPVDVDAASPHHAVDLKPGSTALGRGDLTGIADKAVSREQLVVTVDADLGQIVLVRKGINVTMLVAGAREAVVMDKDSPVIADHGDCFTLLNDKYKSVRCA